MKKTKNLYIQVIGVILFVGMITSVYALGSSYTNEYDKENKVVPSTNDDIYSVMEINPESDVPQATSEAATANALTLNANPWYIETLRVYSAASFIQGAKENPSVQSHAFAVGSFLIDIQSNRLTYNILEFDVKNETGVKILGPANARTNTNNVLATLSGPAGSKTGIWNYPQGSESDILSGRTYINVYTTQNPNGEIRGQIIPTKVYLVRRLVSTQAQDTHTYQVNITNHSFKKQTIVIKKGDTVTWKNYDMDAHTVRSDTGSELNSGVIPTGYSYSHKFTNPGNYSYHCSIHPSMKGTVIVEN